MSVHDTYLKYCSLHCTVCPGSELTINENIILVTIKDELPAELFVSVVCIFNAICFVEFLNIVQYTHDMWYLVVYHRAYTWLSRTPVSPLKKMQDLLSYKLQQHFVNFTMLQYQTISQGRVRLNSVAKAFDLHFSFMNSFYRSRCSIISRVPIYLLHVPARIIFRCRSGGLLIAVHWLLMQTIRTITSSEVLLLIQPLCFVQPSLGYHHTD